MKYLFRFLKILVLAIIVYGCASLANWNFNPGCWKHSHHEWCSLIMLIGSILLLTDKDEDHESQKSA